MTRHLLTFAILATVSIGGATFAVAQAATSGVEKAKSQKTAKPKKPRPPFRWVNRLPKNHHPRITHHTFRSPSMKNDVGYCLYLPPGYDDKANAARRYPVVYYLHGGRPGSETRSIHLTQYIDDAMTNKQVSAAIYVFVNGGVVSHYNTPNRNSMGEDVFIKELIPHVDRTYRTIANRSGRGIEGFSQGGRGTARNMFKHPDLFCSAAPGGGGHATEKRISENDGRENETLKFAKGDNTYDLARKYAANPKWPLRILIYVGDKGFNYENNLAYMRFLGSLEIYYELLIIPGAPHSPRIIYEKQSLAILKFHAESFRQAAAK